MKSGFNWLNLVFALVTSLPGMVQAAEALHGPGNGATKKAAVQNMAQMGLNIAAEADPNLAPMMAAVSPGVGVAIDGTVSMLNSFGILNGSKTPAPFPQAPPTPQIPTAAPQIATAAPDAPAATTAATAPVTTEAPAKVYQNVVAPHA